MKTLIPVATLVALATTVAATSGCGNAWLSAGEREETPSALMQEAQHLYDRGRFAEAAAAYERILALSPQNDRARVRLAYALNGAAGLGPLALLTNLSKLQSKATPTPAAGAGTTTRTSSSNNALLRLTTVAGLSRDEVKALGKANPKTFQELLDAESKFASLKSSDPTTYAGVVSASRRIRGIQEGWVAICRLIPKHILDAVIGTNKVRQDAFAVKECLGGYPQKYQNPAVLFAAAMSTLAQGATLFQVKLDADADGAVDATKTADTLTKDISALNTAANDVTDPDEIKKNVASLNTKIAALNAIGDTLKHELVDVALAQFEIMSLLMTAIEGVIPENVGKSLINGVKKFEESKTAITGYVNTSGKAATGAGAKSQARILSNATNASKAADGYYDKFMEQVDADTSLSAPQKAAQKAEFESTFEQTCSQFDALKSKFGVTAAQRPANCSSTTLTLAGAGSAGFAAGDLDPVEATADAEEASDASDDAGDAAADLLDFARMGERLLRAD